MVFTMSDQSHSNHPLYSVLPTHVEGFDHLVELALDLRWSWNHATDTIWRQLDPVVWEQTCNPWAVLQTVSRDHIEQLARSPAFLKSVDDLIQVKRKGAVAPAWFQHKYPSSHLTCVAYFSMEFMLSEALPIYSGELGTVAGDQLKAACDLGVPLVGVGLLYQQGYFRQLIGIEGDQQAIYPYNDPGQLPIMPVCLPNGEWLRLQLDLPGHTIWLRAWFVEVGKRKLYLLDSNDAANYPPYRGITSELYGSTHDLRLLQEIVLGIGGWRVLEAIGVHPEVCHLNDGHAAFALIERAAAYMQKTGVPFKAALAATRAGNVFTTHTLAHEGFDCFSPTVVEHYMSRYITDKLGITLNEFLDMGRPNSSDANAEFNMDYLAMRTSGVVKGVNRQQSAVSRRLFAPLFDRRSVDEVPVGFITTGVHMPSWDSEIADQLWTQVSGKDRWLGVLETLESDIGHISDARLWQFRNTAATALIEYTRARLARQMELSGMGTNAVSSVLRILRATSLTLGFARRFTTHTRPNLLLTNPERLLALLTNPRMPVQLILAGKANPSDVAGQELIRRWIHFIRQTPARQHVVFLSDYDMLLAEHMVKGVDVWLNSPQRPWEASGYGGMKVLVNGGINLSELNGWWAEAYTSDVGWALDESSDGSDILETDDVDANGLYDILENEVIPEFYNRNEHLVPTTWVGRMRKSMARLTPHFSSNRTVREYTRQVYLSAASAYLARTAGSGAIGVRMADYQAVLAESWPLIKFGNVSVSTQGSSQTFDVQIFLHGLDPSLVKLELYAEGVMGSEPVQIELKPVRQTDRRSGASIYSASISSSRGSTDYTARMLPRFEGMSLPLEEPLILWQR